jgi:hypothetical protein
VNAALARQQPSLLEQNNSPPALAAVAPAPTAVSSPSSLSDSTIEVLAASSAMSWSPDFARSVAISAALAHSCRCNPISSAGDRLRCPPPPPLSSTTVWVAAAAGACVLVVVSMGADPPADVAPAAHCVADAAAVAASVLWERDRLARRGGGLGVSLEGAAALSSVSVEGASRLTLDRLTLVRCTAITAASVVFGAAGSSSVTVGCRSIARDGGGGGAARVTCRISAMAALTGVTTGTANDVVVSRLLS